jgi:hypothetical protein
VIGLSSLGPFIEYPRANTPLSPSPDLPIPFGVSSPASEADADEPELEAIADSGYSYPECGYEMPSLTSKSGVTGGPDEEQVDDRGEARVDDAEADVEDEVEDRSSSRAPRVDMASLRLDEYDDAFDDSPALESRISAVGKGVAGSMGREVTR